MQELMIMKVWVDLSMIYKRAHFQINDSKKIQHYTNKIPRNRSIDSILEYIYLSNIIISKDKQYCSFIRELIWKEKREKRKILSIE